MGENWDVFNPMLIKIVYEKNSLQYNYNIQWIDVDDIASSI